MLDDLDQMIRQLRALAQTEIEIHSPGEYPTKSRTPVSDVHRYQNDGTKTITPARYLERAEQSSNQWQAEIDAAMDAYIAGAGESALQEAADKIAKDVSATCDRVNTGKLKKSFEGKIRRR